MLPKDAQIRLAGEMRPTQEPEGWKPNTKYLYTIATVNKWSHADVKAFIKARFGVDSTKELKWGQYQECLEAFDTFSKAEE